LSALFRALKERFGRTWWRAWPIGVRDRDPAVLAAHAGELDREALYYTWTQWIAHGQWDAARREVNGLGVELMGDLPFMVGIDSADVWARRADFAIDATAARATICPAGHSSIDEYEDCDAPEKVEIHFARESCEPCPLRPRCPVRLKRSIEAYVLKADLVGSTEFIIKTIEAAPAGSTWAIGTELNLVKRLADDHPDKEIVFLDRNVCYCSTMNRIDLPHLVWALENLAAGEVVNRIDVDPDTEQDALVALQRMLDLPGKSHRD
jgi:hypothetical protein